MSRLGLSGLFSGIGGFELGFSDAGFDSRLLCEIEPCARSVLNAHFPDVDIVPDIMELATLPASTTVVTAGFPCQNLSMAGDKKGTRGRNAGTVERLLEIIHASRVPIVVIENVYFMLQLAGGASMNWIASHFEGMGYRWAYRVIDTKGFGIPQRRRRVYFVASSVSDPREILFADETVPAEPLEASLHSPLGFYWTEGRTGIGLTVDGIPPLKIGSTLGIPSAPAVLFPDGEVLMPSLSACEALQGFPKGWLDGATWTSGRDPRWRLIGNAVSVPVVKWIARRITNPGRVRRFPTNPFASEGRWPEAAWNVGTGRTAVMASDRPVRARARSISDFRDETWTRLSERALLGFLSRVREGGLRTPPGFVDALERAKRKER